MTTQTTDLEELIAEATRRLAVDDLRAPGGRVGTVGDLTEWGLVQELTSALSSLLDRLSKAEGERDDLQRTFDIRWAADQRAIALWQALNPGNDLVWPDRADMVVWLLDRLDAIEMSEVTGWPWPQEKTLDELAELTGRDRAAAVQLAIDLGKTFGVPPGFAAHHYIADKGAERAQSAQALLSKAEEREKRLVEAVELAAGRLYWASQASPGCGDPAGRNLVAGWAEEARAALHLSETADQALPKDEGWVLVPREPTREMWAAAGDAVVALQVRGVGHHDKLIEGAWEAMLSALPAPPTTKGEG